MQRDAKDGAQSAPDDREAAAGATPESPAAAAGPDVADDERERVAAVLDQLRAGVRQRRAERMTLQSLDPALAGDGSLDAEATAGDLQSRLHELRQSEYVREPVPTSPRPGVGRWIVLVRKAAYKLFGKWLVRPLLEQQNAYNQAAAAALQELMAREERLSQQLRELTARLAALEAVLRRLGVDDKPPDAGRS